MMDANNPKRRRLQFTLRAFLLLILVVAAFLAGRASMYSTLRQERASAEAAIARYRAELARVMAHLAGAMKDDTVRQNANTEPRPSDEQ